MQPKANRTSCPHKEEMHTEKIPCEDTGMRGYLQVKERVLRRTKLADILFLDF